MGEYISRSTPQGQAVLESSTDQEHNDRQAPALGGEEAIITSHVKEPQYNLHSPEILKNKSTFDMKISFDEIDPLSETVPVEEQSNLLSEETFDMLEVPELLQVHEMSQEPKLSQVSEMSQVPELSQVHEMSQVPELSQVPEMSQVPELSQVPDNSSEARHLSETLRHFETSELKLLLTKTRLLQLKAENMAARNYSECDNSKETEERCSETDNKSNGFVEKKDSLTEEFLRKNQNLFKAEQTKEETYIQKRYSLSDSNLEPTLETNGKAGEKLHQENKEQESEDDDDDDDDELSAAEQKLQLQLILEKAKLLLEKSKTSVLCLEIKKSSTKETNMPDNKEHVEEKKEEEVEMLLSETEICEMSSSDETEFQINSEIERKELKSLLEKTKQLQLQAKNIIDRNYSPVIASESQKETTEMTMEGENNEKEFKVHQTDKLEEQEIVETNEPKKITYNLKEQNMSEVEEEQYDEDIEYMDNDDDDYYEEDIGLYEEYEEDMGRYDEDNKMLFKDNETADTNQTMDLDTLLHSTKLILERANQSLGKTEEKEMNAAPASDENKLSASSLEFLDAEPDSENMERPPETMRHENLVTPESPSDTLTTSIKAFISEEMEQTGILTQNETIEVNLPIETKSLHQSETGIPLKLRNGTDVNKNESSNEMDVKNSELFFKEEEDSKNERSSINNFTLLLKLQKDMSEMQLQMSRLQDAMRSANNVLQNLMDNAFANM